MVNIYRKPDFIQDASEMSNGSRIASKKDAIRWAVQYDLYASDYRGGEVDSITSTLCGEAGDLMIPAESLDYILQRYKEINKC